MISNVADAGGARVIKLVQTGPADQAFVVESADLEPPGPDQVRIAVAYSGLNFADIVMRLGMYPDAPRLPFVPGYEVAGTVDAIGPGVTHVAIGDQAMAGTVFGGYASSIVLPASQVVAKPAALTLAQAASLPVAFFTSHLALHEMARVRAGDRVLIESAAGGVGLLATQMAVAAGATVYGLTSSPAKRELIARNGAVPMLVTEFGDSAERDFDVVLNSSGGATINAQRARLAATGRIVCFGFSSGIHDGQKSYWRAALALAQMPIVPVLKLFGANTGIYGLNALHIMQQPRWAARLGQALAEQAANLRPTVGAEFAAADVAKAHRLLESKGAVGKVVLRWR